MPEDERFNDLPKPEYTTLRQQTGNKVEGAGDEYRNCTPGGESYGSSSS